MLKNMKFKTSAFNIAQLLETEKKQIVLVGKSNVGKSSFINSLANQKHLAKVEILLEKQNLLIIMM